MGSPWPWASSSGERLQKECDHCEPISDPILQCSWLGHVFLLIARVVSRCIITDGKHEGRM